MGNAIVQRQLDALGVHHQQLEVVGGISRDKAGDQGIDAHRLARTRRASDEQVGQLGQIIDHSRSRYITPKGHGQRRLDLGEFFRFHHATQTHHRRLLIGYLQANDALAGHGRLDANRRGGQSQRQVIGQGRDTADFDLDALGFAIAVATLDKARFEPKLGHHRSRVDFDHRHRNSEALQCLLDNARLVPNVRQAHHALDAIDEDLVNVRHLPATVGPLSCSSGNRLQGGGLLPGPG